ncbi:MAG: preprotein translocase subunit SecG [Pseudomonadota bacterium]
METVILIIHVLAAISLVALILLQQGKGADMGAAFGSGASSTVFGSQGSASFLTRATAILATAFFITSLSLAYFTNQGVASKSVTESITEKVDSEEPVEEDMPSVPVTPEGAAETDMPAADDAPAAADIPEGK